jgi:hypothetical protein
LPSPSYGSLDGSFFSGVNINSGVEEDRSNRWIIGALGLIDGKRSEAVVFQLKSGSSNGSGVRPSGIGWKTSIPPSLAEG